MKTPACNVLIPCNVSNICSIWHRGIENEASWLAIDIQGLLPGLFRFYVDSDFALPASGSLHPHRRTRSESDAKSRIAVAPPPEPKRVKLDTPPPEDPPNDRKPPEVQY